MITYWEFCAQLEAEYHTYRKRVMERFHLPAVEVDVLLFLANNPQYVTAAEIARVKRIPKSHVSLAVRGLMEKGLLDGTADAANRKRVCLALTAQAADVVRYGRQEQEHFVNRLFQGFSPEERQQYGEYCKRMLENVHDTQEESKNHVQCQ